MHLTSCDSSSLIGSILSLASFLLGSARLVLVKALWAINTYELGLSLGRAVAIHEELGLSLPYGRSEEGALIKHAPLLPPPLSHYARPQQLLLIIESNVPIDKLLVNRPRLEEASTRSPARLRPLLIAGRMLVDNLAQLGLVVRA